MLADCCGAAGNRTRVQDRSACGFPELTNTIRPLAGCRVNGTPWENLISDGATCRVPSYWEVSPYPPSRNREKSVGQGTCSNTLFELRLTFVGQCFPFPAKSGQAVSRIRTDRTVADLEEIGHCLDCRFGHCLAFRVGVRVIVGYAGVGGR